MRRVAQARVSQSLRACIDCKLMAPGQMMSACRNLILFYFSSDAAFQVPGRKRLDRTHP